MLLSVEKKFIFVHIPKTAGSSITTALQPYSLNSKRTAWRRFCSKFPIKENPMFATLSVHSKASWIRTKIPSDMYDNYCKFAVVRNPFEFAVSSYYFLRKNRGSRQHRKALTWEFSDFVCYLEAKNKVTKMDQSSWICNRKNELIIDQVLCFENLQTDFESLLNCLHLQSDTKLPRTNTTDHEGYQVYYNSVDRRRAEQIFARDIERFSYQF